ncbi:alpha/beta hydrolase [Leifsonia kafniensis]|uniref:Alpha/beta hydrolase n=1 Tax=Leifsonia kafniensis TaxID=475957 RepID=A0ABP7K9I8_9MICO
MSHNAETPVSAIVSLLPKRRLPWWRRALRATGIVAGVVVGLLAVSAVANAVITTAEKASITPYGQKVSIPAGDVNVYRNGGTGPTMVMLSGYGTAAPAIDFAPLIRELPNFNVIVIEGFGYGYSDQDVRNRTVENITAEIHEVLARLGVHSPIILVGHSIGGIYTHYYANAYPGEVSALIGIDPTPAMTSSTKAGEPSAVAGSLTQLGLTRVANAVAPVLVQPDGTAFTKDDRARLVAMADWNFGNASVSDEWAQLAANSTKTAATPLPASVPVLDFLATESLAGIPGWMHNHENELAGVTTHQIQVVRGAHYLHWTQAPLMARAISSFIGEHASQ